MAKPYVVGITGGSGSGKTTFVAQLAERLGTHATVISQDDYYRPLEEVPRDAEGVHNFDLPDSIDTAAMVRDVERILRGETVRLREYTFDTVYRDDGAGEDSTGRAGGTKVLEPRPVLVIEGLFALHEPRLRERMDLTLFVEASDVAKLSRRIRRDRIERGLPLEDVLYRYEAHVLPSYHAFIRPHRARADLIVNNAVSFATALEMVCSYLGTQGGAPNRR